ncbi:MAG: RagB/SusD family nutrient uptake outer membrane protein [Tannerella sp.]|jgi:hypothetical protein|nr:RagB/SusD family nutrient uptake outer membrane protein [Tannerella sp.]
MKTNKIYALLLSVTLLGASSCGDFLTEDNKTGDTGELLYSTKAGIDGLLGACYSYSRAWYGKEAAYGLSEGGTDIFLTGFDNRQKILINYEGITPDVSSNLENMNCNFDEYWELFFSAVNTCNTALQYIETNPVLSDTEKRIYTGEVKSLRAFYYWHLVETWGPVPINRTPVISASSEATRSSELEVYEFMLEDLTDAETALAGQTIKNGHINLWAAKAFKARVLLYKANRTGNNADYTAAAQLAAEVINSSGAKLYENYADCWKMANEGGGVNTEALFYVAYSDILTENFLPLRLKLNDSGNQMTWTNMIKRNNNGGGNMAHMMFVGTWNTGGDVSGARGPFIRITNDNENNTSKGVDLEYYYSKFSRGFTRLVPSVYLLDLFDDETDQRYQASFRDVYDIAPKLRNPGYDRSNWYYSNCMDTAIYMVKKDVTAEEARALSERAAGRYRIMFRHTVPGVVEPALYERSNGLDHRPTRGQSTEVLAKYEYANHQSFQGWSTYIALKKFETDRTTGNDRYTPELIGRDYLVIRLSEMYLIKAEAEMASGSGNALQTLNELRQARAVSGKDNTLSGPVTIDVILDERARELCGEQQRWFDLKRTGTLLERVKKYNPDAKDYIKDFHILRPIPTPQMQAVTNIGNVGEEGKFWQNPGYY